MNEHQVDPTLEAAVHTESVVFCAHMETHVQDPIDVCRVVGEVPGVSVFVPFIVRRHYSDFLAKTAESL